MGVEDVPAGRAIDRARRDQPDQPGELRRVNCDWVRRGVPDPEVVTGDPVRGRLRLEIRRGGEGRLEQPTGVRVGHEHRRVVGREAQRLLVTGAAGRRQLRELVADPGQPAGVDPQRRQVRLRK